MVRTALLSLLVFIIIGCSTDQPKKASEPAPAQPSAAASTPAAAATPVKEVAPSIPSAPAKEAQAEKKEAPGPKKEAPKGKTESGSTMDRFAKCLAEKDATMYGVFWCDHCREQKEKFGESFKYVKYVECVAPDTPRTVTPECKAQGIKHTPTWIFSDGERVEGVMGLDQLAMKTHCKMP